jgi:hypothetical protein
MAQGEPIARRKRLDRARIVASGIIGEGGSQSSRHRTRRVRSDRLSVDEDQRLPVAGNFATSCAATPAAGTGA